jgi:peptidoglycan hydrolase-like protein with peptidoglycan-binding domain
MSIVPTDKDLELAENQKQKTINDIINFTLKTTIGKGYATDEQDVKNTRKKFNALGFDAGHEDFGYSDQKLEHSIRQFQRAQDLKEDGIMYPNGETEKMLTKTLVEKENAPKPKSKPYDPSKIPPRHKPVTPIEKDAIYSVHPEDYLTAKGIAKKSVEMLLIKNPISKAIAENVIADKIKKTVKKVRETLNNGDEEK